MSPQAIVVEDHPLYLDALIHLLHSVLGASAVVAAQSAEEGLRLAASHPNLRMVLMDLALPGCSGAEAIAAFRRACSSATIIVVSASDDRQEINAAFRAGAQVVVSKAAPNQRLVDVVQRLFAGEVLTREWITHVSGDGAVVDKGGVTLTPRQWQVLSYLCDGHNNKEIGLRMDIQEITVKVHVSSILRLLGVTNRQEAILKARRLGLCLPEDETTARDLRC